MLKLSPILIGGLAVLVSSCGSADESVPEPTIAADESPTSSEEASPSVSEPAAVELETSVAEPDGAPDAEFYRKGKIAFLRCRSCHTLEKDGAHLTGPNLNGFFGASAGSKEGYFFSDALIEKGIIWNEETLDAWIENPSAYIPGNRMVFAGLRKPEDRAALIAYLAEETK